MPPRISNQISPFTCRIIFQSISGRRTGVQGVTGSLLKLDVLYEISDMTFPPPPSGTTPLLQKLQDVAQRLEGPDANLDRRDRMGSRGDVFINGYVATVIDAIVVEYFGEDGVVERVGEIKELISELTASNAFAPLAYVLDLAPELFTEDAADSLKAFLDVVHLELEGPGAAAFRQWLSSVFDRLIRSVIDLYLLPEEPRTDRIFEVERNPQIIHKPRWSQGPMGLDLKPVATHTLEAGSETASRPEWRLVETKVIEIEDENYFTAQGRFDAQQGLICIDVDCSNLDTEVFGEEKTEVVPSIANHSNGIAKAQHRCMEVVWENPLPGLVDEGDRGYIPGEDPKYWVILSEGSRVVLNVLVDSNGDPIAGMEATMAPPWTIPDVSWIVRSYV